MSVRGVLAGLIRDNLATATFWNQSLRAMISCQSRRPASLARSSKAMLLTIRCKDICGCQLSMKACAQAGFEPPKQIRRPNPSIGQQQMECMVLVQGTCDGVMFTRP